MQQVETIFAEVDFSKSQATGQYVCSVCSYVYDPAEHEGVFKDLQRVSMILEA